uniref:Uncharacterized protein n=1 Tax=Leersia perrieri TaxID=77586 RepID=A0A0D9XB44_9ORYZ
MGGYEKGESPAEGGVILGVDGGTTNTVCVCLPAAMPPPDSPSAVPVLSRAIAGCSNRNSVGANPFLCRGRKGVEVSHGPRCAARCSAPGSGLRR